MLGRLHRIALASAAVLVAITASAVRAELEPAPEGVEAREVARRSQDALRGDVTHWVATLRIESPGREKPRVVRFDLTDDRLGGRALLRILDPRKHAGTTFLKRHPNLWTHSPRAERTERIQPSMMFEPWMGSDFTYDDLLHGANELDDYEHRLLGVDARPAGAQGQRAFVVEYVPREEATPRRGKRIDWIEIEHGTPLRREFYDDDGAKLRVLGFEDLREVQGRWAPHRWVAVAVDRNAHRSTIEIEELRFDVELDDALFSTRRLQPSD